MVYTVTVAFHVLAKILRLDRFEQKTNHLYTNVPYNLLKISQQEWLILIRIAL